MKTFLSSLLIIVLSNSIIAQTTAIPDANFEQALIDLGYDIGSPDGTVPTSNINSVTFLPVSNKNISDLTGIEDFNALTFLDVYQNQLTNLSLIYNYSLTQLICDFNQLTNLNINTTLTKLSCDGNQLTNLDISQNTALTEIKCAGNNLTCLNLKNGNNTNFTRCWAYNNPNLTCIEVDDDNYSTANWSGFNFNFDANSSFSNNCNNACSTVGIDDKEQLSNTLLYPNPTTGNITITLGEVKQEIKATLTNNLGQVILSQQFVLTDIINMDIDALTGIYFLQIETIEGETKTLKVIIE